MNSHPICIEHKIHFWNQNEILHSKDDSLCYCYLFEALNLDSVDVIYRQTIATKTIITSLFFLHVETVTTRQKISRDFNWPTWLRINFEWRRLFRSRKSLLVSQISKKNSRLIGCPLSRKIFNYCQCIQSGSMLVKSYSFHSKISIRI